MHTIVIADEQPLLRAAVQALLDAQGHRVVAALDNGAEALQQALAEGERKIACWFGRHRMAVVHFADQPDAFINLNDPRELSAYEARLLAENAPLAGEMRS